MLKEIEKLCQVVDMNMDIMKYDKKCLYKCLIRKEMFVRPLRHTLNDYI